MNFRNLSGALIAAKMSNPIMTALVMVGSMAVVGEGLSRLLPVERTAKKPATKAHASGEAERAPIQQHMDQAGDVASTEMSAKKNELPPPEASATTTDVASTAVPAEAALTEKTEMASPGMSATTQEVASPPKARESDLEISVPSDHRTDSNVGAVEQQPLATLAQSTGLEQMTGTGAGRSENRARVDAFILMMLDHGHKITRKDIWIVAGYTNRTEFQRFQSGDRCTKTAKLNFDRVLRMTPEDFVSALRKKSSAK